MASLNKVFLMGNLTRVPALRFTPGGTAVCEFGLAINRRYTVGGQEKDETCFTDIVVWGKQAESCERFLEKGSPVFVEGRLQYDQWDDKETGAKRSKLRIVAERVQFLPRSSERGGDYQENFDEGPADAPPQQQQYRESARPQQQAPRNRPPQQSQPPQQRAPVKDAGRQAAPPPPMPEEAFDVENGEVEDDIPF